MRAIIPLCTLTLGGLKSEGGGSKEDEYREKISGFQEPFRNAQSDEERGAIAQDARNWFLKEIWL